MNIKELELTEQQIKEFDELMLQCEDVFERKGAFEHEGDRLPTLGFGIPNLLKFGAVG